MLAETREQYEAEVSTGLYEEPAAKGLLIQLAALGHRVGTPHSCQEDGTQLPTSSFGTHPGHLPAWSSSSGPCIKLNPGCNSGASPLAVGLKYCGRRATRIEGNSGLPGKRLARTKQD